MWNGMRNAMLARTSSNQGSALTKKIFLSILVTLLLLSSATGCYAKGPWRGKVIDAETKQPIEGAVVVAIWYYKHITPVGGANETLDEREAITNANGQFEFTARRYLFIPFIRDVQDSIAFTIYKPGYGSFPGSVAPRTKNTEEINKWSIKYENMFKNKEDVVELPVMKSNQDRQDVLNDVEARMPLDFKAKLKKISALIDAENAYLGLIQGK